MGNSQIPFTRINFIRLGANVKVRSLSGVSICFALVGAFVQSYGSPMPVSADPQAVISGKVRQETLNPEERFRGWEHLVERLHRDGVPLQTLRQVYQSSRMQVFNPIYFKVKPREPSSMYKGFLTPARLKTGRECMNKHAKAFKNAEKRFGVSRYVLGGLLLVESNCGTILGRSRIVERLSRLAGLSEPGNIKRNYRSLIESGEKVTLQEVKDRALYLENLFTPELPALFRYAKREGLDPLEIRGSYGGAFGITQFLPTSLERFGTDGNGDGKISLFVHADAIASAANFLFQHGWKNSLSHKAKREVIRKYNNSDPYIDTVLSVANSLK